MEKYNSKKTESQAMVKFAKSVVKPKTAKRVDECGAWLDFIADKPMEKRKLFNANFCNWRFCPMCAWRKAIADSLKLAICMEYIHKKQHKDFIFLTLTAPNVPAEKLRDEITRQNYAFNKMFKRNEVKKMCHGFVRKTEITYNPERDDYHPHLHVVVAVTKGYFSGGRYIKQASWLEMWREVMRDNSITQVDVRKVKRRTDADGVAESFEVAEFAKYAAKDSDYAKNQDVFETFYNALKGRRQLTYGGLFKIANEMYKTGDLDDFIKPDLTEYYWRIAHKWSNSEYMQGDTYKLNGMDRRLMESYGIIVDSEIEKIVENPRGEKGVLGSDNQAVGRQVGSKQRQDKIPGKEITQLTLDES